MTTAGAPAGLVPIHVGHPAPAAEAAPTGDRAGGAGPRWMRGQRSRRSPFVDPGIEWQRHGFEPRWVGMETSDCAAALEPNIFRTGGESELERFMSGAAGRGETALIVATIGDAGDDTPRSPLATADASISLPAFQGTIHGSRLPSGARPSPAGGLSQADRDLALRLLNRPADAPWWSLGIGGVTLLPGGGGPPTSYEPDGELEPILADSLGAPVVAAWVPGEGNQRWYVIPDATDWNGILDWLIHRALPAHVPNALRRARSPHFADPSLQTAAEAAAREALGALEASYVEEKARLEDELRRTSGAADPIRYGLLYGTGSELVEAVASVLEQAGLTTVNVDDLLGGSTSADLLVSREDERRLVEVKSASGSASEALVGALERHLQTWPQFRPGEPVSGGVLIVNHQHTLEPHERAAAVYSRPEFVSVLAVPVISTRELFEWWRASDWASIREAVLATPNPGAEPKRAAPAAGAPPESSPPATRRLPRLPWRRNDN